MKKYLNIFIIGSLLLIPTNTLAKKAVCSTDNGYEAIVEIDKDTIKVGEQAFLAVNSNNSIEKVNYRTDNIDLVSIDNNGIVKGQKDGTAVIEATINFDATNKCNTKLEIAVVSSDSSLKSLTTNEYDLTNIFQKDKYEYEIKLPYKNEEINITATANNSKAKITGDGKKYLNVGNNNFTITVTAEDKTTSTYKLNVIREKGDSDNTLKSLEVTGYNLTPKFTTDNKEYKLELDENVEEITIGATANSSLATIKGIGTYKVVSGESTYFINVIAEDGSINKYSILVNKKKGSTKLKSLAITGVKLEPKFTSNTFTYYLNVGSDIPKLDIKAEAEENDSIVITGNEFLDFGQNEILIKVSNPEKTTNTYKLIVNRMNAEMEKSINRNSTLVKVLFVLFIISVIIMSTLIGIFIKRNYQRKNKLSNKIKKDLKKKFKK